MNKYILSLDQGTGSSRALIFNQSGQVVGKSQKEFTQIYPRPGWVEHDPEQIWQTTIDVIKNSLTKSGIKPEQIQGIGITNQRETTIIWDKRTGQPIHNAIVWQDRRTSDICDRLKNEGLEEKIKEKTGLVIDSYFSSTKIKWLLDNVSGAKEKAEQGLLKFGTVDSWLVWRLSGGRTHITDYTNASRTMLFNINTLEWDPELLNIFSIPREILPEIRSCSEIYTETNKENFFGENIPLAGIAGDQQAATFGQGCYEKGIAKNTYGTGCFMLLNTGQNRVKSENGLLTTIAWGIDKDITYALEGSVFVAGAAVQWLRDELDLIDNAAESEYLARQVESTDGVYVVPAFTGLGAPYWDQYARGTIVGLTRGTTKQHLVRATLESLAYQSRDLLEAMKIDSGLELKELRVDGGAAENDFLIQFQADILNSNVERPVNTETTALGAAYLAGLAVGYWKNKNEVSEKRRVERTFMPQMEAIKRKELYNNWKRAVKRSRNWIQKDKKDQQ
ncbi:MAG: glycerol kinase GlpK [Bacillota bacterium]